MSIARRVLLIAAIAALAVVPLRAFGVVGAGGPSGLSVSASLGGCGVAGDGIVCQIDVSFTGVEGAEYYTASVTRADGSVQDLGTVGSGEGGGGASVSVPYVGAGNYSVTVSAWGTPDDEDEPKLLDRERTDTREHAGAAEPADAEDAPAEDPEGDAEAPGLQGADEAAPAEPAPAEPPPQTLPECRPEAAAPVAEEPADGEAPAEAEAPPASPPVTVAECTTPSSDAGGPCCPPGA